MRVFGLAGWSGSGKTTLIERILPEIVKRGVSVSTIKHAHHGFDIDRPGKDSWKHREAGATEVMIASASRWALLHELDDEDEPALEDLAARLSPVELLIVEGFKRHSHPKLEIIRPGLGKPRLHSDDETIIGVVWVEAPGGAESAALALPQFAATSIPAITDFIMDHAAPLERQTS